MIMPCMNSTSACDRGGSVALVDGGSVLLGLPGAPGCTTTGFAGSVCCERETERKKPAEVLGASKSGATISRLWFTAMKRCVRSDSEAQVVIAIRGDGLFAALA